MANHAATLALPHRLMPAPMTPTLGTRYWPDTAFSETRRQLAVRLLLVLAWGLSHEVALRWILLGLTQPSHMVQRFILLGVAALALFDLVTQPPSAHAHPRAPFIVLVSLTLDIAVHLYSRVQLVQALAALLLLYASCACFMGAQAWRKRFVLLMVVLLCLPVQPHVDAHLGLPLRLWTARAIAPLLQLLGVHNVTAGSIIVTENAVADVANACSGVRTLWYAVALWLAARLMWPHTAARRWWLAGALSIAVAVGMNALRVAALVLALHHQAPALLADMAHASLGLLALALVGIINLLLCRGSSGAPTPAQEHTGARALAHGRAVSWRLPVVLAGLMLATALLPRPRNSIVDAVALQALAWSPELHTVPLPLSEQERSLIMGHDATVAEKQRFQFKALQGSLLVMQSGNWRAHHAPELCLLAQGAKLGDIRQVGTNNGAFRAMSMQGDTQTAITWFQSGVRVLPDLGARWWSQLLRPQEQWALITVVADQTVSADVMLQLHQAVHAVVATSPRKPQ